MDGVETGFKAAIAWMLVFIGIILAKYFPVLTIGQIILGNESNGYVILPYWLIGLIAPILVTVVAVNVAFIRAALEKNDAKYLILPIVGCIMIILSYLVFT